MGPLIDLLIKWHRQSPVEQFSRDSWSPYDTLFTYSNFSPGRPFSPSPWLLPSPKPRQSCRWSPHLLLPRDPLLTLEPERDFWNLNPIVSPPCLIPKVVSHCSQDKDQSLIAHCGTTRGLAPTCAQAVTAPPVRWPNALTSHRTLARALLPARLKRSPHHPIFTVPT